MGDSRLALGLLIPFSSYWFVDFKQGRAFWSSGTIPGGFGRLVRSIG